MTLYYAKYIREKKDQVEEGHPRDNKMRTSRIMTKMTNSFLMLKRSKRQ